MSSYIPQKYVDAITFWYLTHWGRDKMAANFQTALWNGMSWRQICEFRFIRRGTFNNFSSLIQTMAWCRPGDQPLPEPTQWWLVYWRIYALLGINEITCWIMWEFTKDRFAFWILSLILFTLEQKYMQSVLRSQYHACWSLATLGARASAGMVLIPKYSPASEQWIYGSLRIHKTKYTFGAFWGSITFCRAP